MEKINIAINGFGRIGRHVLKAAWENEHINIVGINDLTDNATLAHLLKYDTAYGAFGEGVSADEDHLIVGGRKIRSTSERDPAALPWKELNVHIVLECTGVFRTKEKAGAHLTAGAQKVIISAPSKGDGVEGFVRGVNCETYAGQDIIDTASCTTNCTAPVMAVLDRVFGVEKGLMSTVHSYTADQNLQDGPHRDLRRARAAAQNIVPTSTGAAIAVTRAIPSLEGKFDGIALRVPTITVSLTDFCVVLKRDVTVEEVNAALKEAAAGPMRGILEVTDEPLVSSDYIGNSASSIVDLGLTHVVGGNLVKVIAWYDNEWGYANRLVEMALIMSKSVA